MEASITIATDPPAAPSEDEEYFQTLNKREKKEVTKAQANSRRSSRQRSMRNSFYEVDIPPELMEHHHEDEEAYRLIPC